MTRLVNEPVGAGGRGCSALPQPGRVACQAREREMLVGVPSPGSPPSCPPLPLPFCGNPCPLLPSPTLRAALGVLGAVRAAPLPRPFEASLLELRAPGAWSGARLMRRGGEEPPSCDPCWLKPSPRGIAAQRPPLRAAPSPRRPRAGERFGEVGAPAVGCGSCGWSASSASPRRGDRSPGARPGGGPRRLLALSWVAAAFLPSLCHVGKLFRLPRLNFLIHKTETKNVLVKRVAGPSEPARALKSSC